MTTPSRAGPTVGRTITNPILKEDTIFLEISRENGGRHTLIDVLLSKGAGNPMHYHDDVSEEFTCLEGELSIQIGKQVIRLKPGESITAPARSKHRFFNQSGESCRFQCRFTPGFPGFEQSLQISYGLARDGKTTARGMPKNLYTIGYLVLISGTYLTGGMAFFQPLLNWLGRQAIKNGVAADLQRRYLAVW
ncbi:hypothetical protein GCM10028805_26280 [Spirosoma harenae]